MSQDVFSTIDPNTTSGTQLAAILNNFKEAVMSGFIGPTRPDEITAGGIWVDNSQGASPTFRWRVKLFTGLTDIVLFDVNTQSGSFTISGTENLFNIVRNSDDDVSANLRLTKRRVAGTGGLDAGDDVGAIQFYGRNSSMVDRELATIIAETLEGITPTTGGTALIFKATKTGTVDPLEMARIVDGKLGIGVSPQETIHANGNLRLDETDANATGKKIILRKRRVAGNGQTTANDVIGTVETRGTDQNGTSVAVTAIESKVTANTTDVEQASQLSFKTKIATDFIDSLILAGNKATVKDLKIDSAIARATQVSTTDATIIPLATAPIVKLTNVALTTITGISFSDSVQELIIINATGNELIVKNEDLVAGNSAIITGTGDELELAVDSVIYCVRDNDSAKWRLVGGAGGGAGGGKKVIGSMASPVVLDSNEYAFTGSQGTLLVFAEGDTAGELVLDSITNGKKPGQELHFYFTSPTNLVLLDNSGSVITRGDFLSDENSYLRLIWNGLNWVEIGRN